MKYLKKVCLVTLVLSCIVGCTVNKSTIATSKKMEKLSIAEKLKENSELPIEERIALYHQLKKKKPNTYNFENEKELNDYAYELMKSDREEEAIELFKLNVEQFPNSGTAHENLADGYNFLAYKYQNIAKANIKKANEIWSILDMNDDWGTEIFHFPIRFAKEIPYKGIEDARFPKGWSDVESDYFWTYLFGWNIESKEKLTTTTLEDNLKLYFDGLMESVNREKSVNPKITTVKLEKSNDKSFKGTVHVFDAFKTKKPLTLNVLIDFEYCESNNTTQILFRFSPKGFDHDVWKVLKIATFQDDLCQ